METEAADHDVERAGGEGELLLVSDDESALGRSLARGGGGPAARIARSVQLAGGHVEVGDTLYARTTFVEAAARGGAGREKGAVVINLLMSPKNRRGACSGVQRRARALQSRGGIRPG